MSLAMTLSAPCWAASASTSSLPIWPLAPMTKIRSILSCSFYADLFFEQAEFKAGLFECFEYGFELGARMRGRQLDPHARLAHRDHRVEEAAQQNAQLIHSGRELLRHRRIEQHHRYHRVRARLDGEADALDLGAEEGGVFVQAVAQLGRRRQLSQHRQRGAGDSRR